MPSRNAVTMGSMPSAWLLARGPYSCSKASSAKVPTTTVGTPLAVPSAVFRMRISTSEPAYSRKRAFSETSSC